MSNISIGDRSIRKMALLLLDATDGIDVKAYEILSVMLTESGNEDILEHVDVYEDAKRHCAFIGEDFAEEELAKIAEAEEAENISEARIEDPVCEDDEMEEDPRINPNDRATIEE